MEQITIFTRRHNARRNRSFLDPSYVLEKITYRLTGSVTEGILRSEVRRAGFAPKVVELSDSMQVKTTRGNVALISVNDPITLVYAIENKRELDRRFKVLVFGGQLPSLTPWLVRKFFPEANIFSGECEGRIALVLEDACSVKVGVDYSAPTYDIQKVLCSPRTSWEKHR